MLNLLSQPALQQQTLRFYGELTALAPSWAGKLLLGVGEGCSASGLPAACSLTSGACLLLEPSVNGAKAALRDGGLDFLVSTVDEALRTLRNEIRKARPLAVALVCDPAAALAELQDRGVLPDLTFSMHTHAPTRSLLSGWTDVPVFDDESPKTPVGSEVLQLYLKERNFTTHTWSLPGRSAIQALDAALLAVLQHGDDVRSRWLTGLPRYQRSADRDYRTAWMTPQEQEQVAACFNSSSS